jgi:hypothetical protein
MTCRGSNKQAYMGDVSVSVVTDKDDAGVTQDAQKRRNEVQHFRRAGRGHGRERPTDAPRNRVAYCQRYRFRP